MFGFIFFKKNHEHYHIIITQNELIAKKTDEAVS